MSAPKKQLNMPNGLQAVLDKDVAMVLEFMQLNIEGRKLIDVANAVKDLAGPLWGHSINNPIPWSKFIPIALRES